MTANESIIDIKKRLIVKHQALMSTNGSTTVSLGELGYMYTDKKHKTRPLMTYDYCWHKMHFIHAWLRENGCKRIPAFVVGDVAYYRTMKGWHTLKALEKVMQYECQIKNTACYCLHPLLAGLEGCEVFMIKNGSEQWGVVSVAGTYLKYHCVTKPSNMRGVNAMPWDVIELR